MKRLFTVMMVVLSLILCDVAAAQEAVKQSAQEDKTVADVGKSAEKSTTKTLGRLMVGYDFSFEDKPENTSRWGLSLVLSVDHSLTDLFYCGAGVGYSTNTAKTKYEKKAESKTSSEILKFPIYFGVSPIDRLKIDTGPSFNWLIAGGTKITDEDGKTISDLKYRDMEGLKRFTPSWRVTVRMFNFIHVGLDVGLKKNSGVVMTVGLSI